MFCIVFVAFLSIVQARDFGMRAVPGIRDSIINLGKMDVSFYMNGKPEDFKHKHFQESSEITKTCTCSHDDDDELRFLDNLMNSHSSHHQPAYSTKCCQKDVHEDIIFAFTPKIHPKRANSQDSLSLPFNSVPFPLSLLMDPTKLKLPAVPKRNKNIEIVLFPKRKDVENELTTKEIKPKKEIKGDEEKNFKKLDLLPVPVVQNNLDENTEKVQNNKPQDSTPRQERKAEK